VRAGPPYHVMEEGYLFDALFASGSACALPLPSDGIAAASFGAGASDAVALATDAITAGAIAAGAFDAAALAADAIIAAKVAAEVSAEIADSVWHEMKSGHRLQTLSALIRQGNEATGMSGAFLFALRVTCKTQRECSAAPLTDLDLDGRTACRHLEPE
jgi:hypothetical protein